MPCRRRRRKDELPRWKCFSSSAELVSRSQPRSWRSWYARGAAAPRTKPGLQQSERRNAGPKRRNAALNQKLVPRQDERFNARPERLGDQKRKLVSPRNGRRTRARPTRLDATLKMKL